jgi:predicted transcriptional regulator
VNTVVLEVRSLRETLGDAARAMKTGRAESEVRMSFATSELLWEVLTAKRWELLKALCGVGRVSIREAARRVGRDVKAVHGDVTALLNAGVLTLAPDGRIEFPLRCHEGRVPAPCRIGWPGIDAEQAHPHSSLVVHE